MSFLDQYKDQPDPTAQVAAPNQDKGGNYMDQYKDQTPQQATEDKSSLWQSAGKGILGVVASPAPLTGFEPPEWMESVGKANDAYFKKTPEEKEAELNKTFPNADQSRMGKMVEKGAEGATYGALTGPAGIIPGALSGAASELHNELRPDHPLENIGVGLATGIGGGKLVGKAAEFGAKTGRSILERFGIGESPVNDLYRDIGSAGLQGGPRISGANDSTRAWQQLQNAQREGIGGGERIASNEQELFRRVEDRAKGIADSLGPDLSHQELGEFVQGHAVSRADQIHNEISSLYTALNNIVPKAATIAPSNLVTALQDITSNYAGAPRTGAVAVDPYVQRLLQSVQQDVFRSPNGQLPYKAVDALRRDIGEQVSKGAIDPSIDVKQMRFLYSALSKDLESAYSPNGLRAFRTVNAAAEKQFDDLGRLQGITKVGLEPETITTRLLAQANKGSTRIDDITSQLNNVDPDTRSTVMGYVLRRLGETPDKSFNPATFYRNWEKLSPEAKALYPPAQREGIDRLGQLSGLIANSFESANSSHTSGNLATLERIGSAVKSLTGAALGGAAGLGSGNIAGLEHQVVPMAMFGSAIGATAFESIANNMIARLLTNKTFNIWLATEAPHLTPDKLPLALGALAAQAPAIGTELGVLKSTIEKQMGAVPQGILGEHPKQQAQGGPVNMPPKYALGGLTDTANLSTLPTEKGGKDKDTSQEDQSTMMHNKNPQGYSQGSTNNTPDVAREMALMMGNQGYSQGGAVNDTLGLAEGGNVVANENEPPGSLIDQFLNHNSSVIPFKTGAAGKYSNRDMPLGINDLVNYPGIEKSGRPFSQTEGNQKSGFSLGRRGEEYSGGQWDYNASPETFGQWVGPDAMGPQPANSNTRLPVSDWNGIDDFVKNPWGGYAQGGVAQMIPDKLQQIDRLTNDRLAAERGEKAAGSPNRSFSEIAKDQLKGTSQSYATGGAVDDDKMLNQIAYRESNNKNVMNYINDPKHTAGGIYQITNTTWRDFAPSSILSQWTRAIDAPPEVQKEVAKLILHSPGGIHHWMDYNPKLRADIQGGHYGNFDNQMANLKGSSEGATNDLPNTELEPQAETPQEIQQDRPSQPSILEAVLSDNPLAQQLVRTIRET